MRITIETIPHAEQRIPGQALVHVLADLVCGLHVEDDSGHDANRTKRDHGTVEVGLAPAQPRDLAIRANQLEPPHRRRQVPVGDA